MTEKDFMGRWFRDGSEPDPMHAAQKGLRPELPKRFYAKAGVIERDGLFAVGLDGKPVRTPAKALLAVPERALAEALAAEWEAQADVIDPARMPLTRIVNSAIDGVAREKEAVAAEIVKYAGSDLLCYRAEEPAALARRQQEAWDLPLGWAAETLGARLATTTGVIATAQPAEATDAIKRTAAALDPLSLAAVHVMTTLTGSAVLALAVAAGRMEPEAAWAAAHVDEDFQIEQWGPDEEASERRSKRWREMEAAARLLALGGGRAA